MNADQYIYSHILYTPAPINKFIRFDIESAYHSVMVNYLIANVHEITQGVSYRICRNTVLDAHDRYQRVVREQMHPQIILPHIYLPVGIYYINKIGLCMVYSTETLRTSITDLLGLIQTFNHSVFKKNYQIKFISRDQ